MAGLHTNRGAKRAREAREALGIDAAEPLTCLLSVVEQAAGIPVIVRPLPGRIAGCLWHDGATRLIHVNGLQALARQRFTLAHELGHVRCGHDGALVVDDPETIGGATADPREMEANAFAAEFLVPRSGLEHAISREPTLDDLVRLAAAHGVSAIVVLLRCVTCGLVGAQRERRLREEIDEGLHLERHAALQPPSVSDRLAAIHELPYLSPALAGGALAAALAGGASVRQIADAAEVAERALAPSIAALTGRAHPSGPPTNSRSSSSSGTGAGAIAARDSTSMSSAIH
jgi:Zn-dependent peptidase ImmA (M78 family)